MNAPQQPGADQQQAVPWAGTPEPEYAITLPDGWPDLESAEQAFAQWGGNPDPAMLPEQVRPLVHWLRARAEGKALGTPLGGWPNGSGPTWDGMSLAELGRENKRLKEALGGPSQWQVEEDLLEKQYEIWRGREALRRLDARGREPVRLVPAAEVRRRERRPDLVEGLIPAAPSIGVLFGESGAYKSFVVLNLLLCTGAVPAAFLGHMVNASGWGVYVMGEGQGDAGQRLDAAVKAHPGFADERLCYIEQPFPLSDEQAVDEVIARCRELADRSGIPVVLVVFDSLADFYGAGDSENSSTDMQRLIAGMKRISAALGCVVMANAHTGHGGRDEDGNDKPPPQRLRGSSRFKQAWDFELMATGRALVPTKNRYGPLAAAVPYQMESRDGTLVLAAEAAAAEAADGEGWPQDERHPLELMTAAEEKTFGAVVAYLREHGDAGPLSFRRVDQGTKGKQATKRQMLDKAVSCGWLAEEEMTGGRPRLRLPGAADRVVCASGSGMCLPVSR